MGDYQRGGTTPEGEFSSAGFILAKDTQQTSSGPQDSSWGPDSEDGQAQAHQPIAVSPRDAPYIGQFFCNHTRTAPTLLRTMSSAVGD